MANSLDVKIVEDGRRNAVVKIVGVADSSDIVLAPAITLSSFSNNDVAVSLVGFKVVEADYSGTPGLLVSMDWNANAPQNIFALSTSAEINGRRHGGFKPDTTANGYDGNLNLKTQGFTPGSLYGFTIVLRMVKMYA